MKKELYRQEALTRLASPEQLDQLMPLTSTRAWMALATIGVGLLIAFAWLLFGKVSQQVNGQGVLIRTGGVRQVTAPVNGTIEKLLVSAGDTVQPTQELFRIRSSEKPGKPQSGLSPFQGRVLDVSAHARDTVEQGEPLVRLESLEHPLQAVLYVPVADAYRIQPGMDVEIRSRSSDAAVSGILRGKVKSMSRFPVTRASLLRTLVSEDLVASVGQSGPSLEITVELLPVAPEILEYMYSGTPCLARITTGQFRPLDLIMPSSGAPRS